MRMLPYSTCQLMLQQVRRSTLNSSLRQPVALSFHNRGASLCLLQDIRWKSGHAGAAFIEDEDQGISDDSHLRRRRGEQQQWRNGGKLRYSREKNQSDDNIHFTSRNNSRNSSERHSWMRNRNPNSKGSADVMSRFVSNSHALQDGKVLSTDGNWKKPIIQEVDIEDITIDDGEKPKTKVDKKSWKENSRKFPQFFRQDQNPSKQNHSASQSQRIGWKRGEPHKRREKKIRNFDSFETNDESEMRTHTRPFKSKSSRKQEREQFENEEEKPKRMNKVKIVAAKIEKKEVVVEIPKSMTLRDLSMRSGVGMHTLISTLIRMGGMEEEDNGVSSVLGKTQVSPHVMMQLRMEAEGGKRRAVGHQVSAVAESLQITAEVAELLCLELGLKTKEQQESSVDEFRTEIGENAPEELRGSPRAPVVTVMGHVDHGKTTLLDALRNAKVAESEAGGITQAVGAFSVDLGDDLGSGSKVIFLDTPGHAAFSSMRKCGAVVTDIVVLVVAATDGIRPQTLESIELAKAANVPIVVALTKIDMGVNKDEAVQRITDELNAHGVKTEEIGGDIQVVPVSAVKQIGLDDLTEAIKLQAEMMNLRANRNSRGEAVVLESRRDRAMGAVADMLVRWGTMKVGDIVVVGEQHGKVRKILDDTGKQIKAAGPSTPIQLTGLSEPPTPGSDVLVVPTVARAREVVALRQRRRVDAEARKQLIEEEKRKEEMELESTMANEDENGDATTSEITNEVVIDPIIVPVVLKADTDGSLEALRYSVDALTMEIQHKAEESKKQKEGSSSSDQDIDYSILPEGSGFKVIRHGVGAITAQDIDMAAAFGGTIFGFNVRAPKQIVVRANNEGVEIVTQGVIYHLLDDMSSKLKAHLPQQEKLEITGSAEVLQTFTMSGKKRSDAEWVVAGCRVLDGSVLSKSRVRVVRDGEIIHKSSGIDSLRHFKERVSSVNKGSECGITLTGFQEFRKGDIIEAFEIVKQAN